MPTPPTPDRRSPAVALLLIAALAPATLEAADWPEILGPNRNGLAINENLDETWPSDGPRLLWQREVGSGFSGVAVAEGRVILFDRKDNRERVTALAADGGRRLWQKTFTASFVPRYVNDNGPRAVPTIRGERVIVFGAQGALHCLDVRSGKTLWSRDTMADFNSTRSFKGEPPEGYFGKGSTPIVVGDLVLVNVGGAAKKAGVVAFNVANGKTAWAATDVRASYSSPILYLSGERPRVVFAARLNVVGLDPLTGREYYRVPFGRTGPTVTAANPLMIDDHLFITASYGFGAVMFKVGDKGLKEVWRSDTILSSQYTTPVPSLRYMYGVHGRQDAGRAALRCVEIKTGKVAWSQAGFGYCTLIAADGKLLILKTDGTLILAKMTPQKYHQLASAKIFGSNVRALPALARGRFFARDGSTLKCFAVGKIDP